MFLTKNLKLLNDYGIICFLFILLLIIIIIIICSDADKSISETQLLFNLILEADVPMNLLKGKGSYNLQLWRRR